jgi:hypothetical protein
MIKNIKYIFQRDKNMLALCTNREILEIDIKNLKTIFSEEESDSD